MAVFDLDFTGSPYGKSACEKESDFTEKMLVLTEYHRRCCPPYRRMLSALSYEGEKVGHYKDIPFLPVGLFKSLELKSVPGMEDTEGKVVTSSGTGGQLKSRIFLDGRTRTLQQQALAAIVRDFLGKSRLPMLVIDCPAAVSRRDTFSARTAGIQGFSLFGRNRTFALKDDMSLDMEALRGFLEQFGERPFLIFGFTYLVWQKLCLELERRGVKPDLSKGILIHGGGWKKLEAEKVDREEFKKRLLKCCGIRRVHDYYGMAEQSGSIFMECECGHLHCSEYSGILFRRPGDFSLCDVGEPGIIQVLSVLPHSYPGHSLLTEDMGVLLGTDGCPCGRKGAYFQVMGRLKDAEIRGCSDTYGEN